MVWLLLTQAKRRTEDYRKAASVGASSQPEIDAKLKHLTETGLMLARMLDARSIEIDALGQFEEQQRLLHAALEVILDHGHSAFCCPRSSFMPVQASQEEWG